MRRKVILVALLAASIAVAAGLALLWPCGVRVTVTNRGPEPLADVVIHVTGNSYRLGTLRVGESRTVSVQPRSESHVELEFTSGSGERSRLNAGGYIEGGYEGTIEVDLEDSAIVRNEHQISIGLFGF